MLISEFGYFTNKWTEEPSVESKYAKKRVMKTQQWQQVIAPPPHCQFSFPARLGNCDLVIGLGSLEPMQQDIMTFTMKF